ISVRTQVVRPVVILGWNLLWRNELLDFDVARGFRFQARQVLFIEDHKGSRFDLKAFLDLFIRNFFARFGVDHMLLHAMLRLHIEDVKTHRLAWIAEYSLTGTLVESSFRSPFQIALAAITHSPLRLVRSLIHRQRNKLEPQSSSQRTLRKLVRHKRGSDTPSD